MKFSERWLREWVNPDISTETLLTQLTMAGLEVDSFGPVDAEFEKDVCIEIDLTPNRGDCLSIAGIARDVATLNACALTPVDIKDIAATIEQDVAIDLQAPSLCPNYVGRVIKNVDLTRPTPDWMREKLMSSGVRSLDPIVDVTNYVMLELGQPMHAFDLNKIDGHIRVREARKGETLTLLDGTDLELHPGSLLIADGTQPLALAGIMGGESSAVSTKTNDIFLESAFFERVHIATHARDYACHTDSSHRFERGVDPHLQERAIQRATALLLDIVGGEAGPLTMACSQAHMPACVKVSLRLPRIAQVLGIEPSQEKVIHILESLGMIVTSQKNSLDVEVPSYRFDISIEEDLIEEVARIISYDNIPISQASVVMSAQVRLQSELDESVLADSLKARDFTEVITYSFVDPDIQAILFPSSEAMMLENPISTDLSQMRVSLWPGLLMTLKSNQSRQRSRVRIFEMGLTFQGVHDQVNQVKTIAGLIAGSRFMPQWGVQTREVDFYDLKADLEALLSVTGRSHELRFEPATHPALHPGQCARILIDGQRCGFIGAVHPDVMSTLQVKGRAFVFEVNVSALKEVKQARFQPISKFQANKRDLSFFVGQEVSAQALLDAIYALNEELVTDLHIFDVYEGEDLDKHQKSVAISLTLQHPSRTLTDAEIGQAVDRVVECLKTTFHISLRD